MAHLDPALAVTTTVTVATGSVRPWLLDNRDGSLLLGSPRGSWWIPGWSQSEWENPAPFYINGVDTPFSDAVYLGL